MPMPRVFATIFATETNSFSPVQTTVADFAAWGTGRTTDLLDAARPLDRMLLMLKQHTEVRGGTFLHGYRGFAQPGAELAREDYQALRHAVLEDLGASLPVDIVFLGLHGAMIAEDETDPEGDIIGQVRQIVGPQTVIGVSLDPHGHLSQRMLDNADIINFYKEYPHSDMAARAIDILDLAFRTQRGEIRPIMTMRAVPVIQSWPTQVEPVRSFVDWMYAIERANGALSVSFIHSFPWGDSPDLGAKILVVTDGDAEAGMRIADDLAESVWAMRDKLEIEYLDIDTALDRAAGAVGGPVVIADIADNSGGGAPQDSTFILRRLVERGIDGAAVALIHDPVTIAQCFELGEGVELDVAIGGRHGAVSGSPFCGRGLIMALRESGAQKAYDDDTTLPLGSMAWIRIGGVDVVLAGERTQVYSPDVFTAVGIRPEQYRLLIVKSRNHFYDYFAPIAHDILYVDTPGAMSERLAKAMYRRVGHPLWPHDAVSFGRRSMK